MKLRVVVRVDVDEAGCDRQAVGVDLAVGGVADASDLYDLAVAHRDVGGNGRCAGAVDNAAAADDEVEGAHAGWGIRYMSSALRPKRPALTSGAVSSFASRSSSTTPGYFASLCGKSDAHVSRSPPTSGAR